MDCYNCGELGHLAHQCPKPKKDKYKNKNKNKGKKDDSSDEEEEKKKNKPYKKKDGKKEFTRRRKMAKPTLLVIGSWKLSHLVTPPVMKVMMRKKMLPHL
jgi:hypothetical protein